jgi:iron complex outermembrane receptor protein
VAAVLAAAAGGAYAADNPAGLTDTPKEDQLEEVVVSGIRYAAQESVKAKRLEESIVEVVTAEDIGKLPDPSVAESIARLPGISGQRIGGRIQDISVRGFSGDYTTTTLNGREQASTGDNRAVQFDQYPGEVVQAVMVYKTTDAERTSSGLAGTIDIRTMRPLSYDHDVLAVGARGERNSLGSLMPEGNTNGYRINATWISKFADNTLGVGLAYARLSSPEEEQHYKAYFYNNDGPPTTNPNAVNPPVGTPPVPLDYQLDGLEVYNYSRLDVRDGVVGAIEWRPNESLHSMTDLYFSAFSQNSFDTGVDMFTTPGAGTTGATNYSVIDVPYSQTLAALSGSNTPLVTEFVNKATYGQLNPVILNEFQGTRDRIYAIGENLQYDLDSKWHAWADLSYSYAHREQDFLQEYAGFGPALGSGLGGSVTVNGELNGLPQIVPSLSYTNPGSIYLGDAAPWGGWGHDGTAHSEFSTDKIAAIKLKGAHEMGGFFNQLLFGVGYQHRTKDRSELDYNLCLPANLVNPTPASYSCVNNSPITVPVNLLTAPTNMFAGFGPVETWNTRAASASIYTLSPINDTNQYSLDYSVTEKLTTGYIQLQFRGSLGETPFYGDIGASLIHTQQSSTGESINSTFSALGLVPYTAGASYNDFLPSINLIFDLTPDTKLRAYAAKTMVRPEMVQLANYTNASANQITTGPLAGQYYWSGSGGNPYLRPWRANAYDVSIEKYFASGNYFAVAGFYKELTTFIDDSLAQIKDFTAAGFTYPGKTFATPLGIVTAPQNFSGGVVKGLEASLVLDAGSFYSPLKGFGAQVSEAWTDSSIPPDPQTGPTLPGLSAIVRTLTGYYERFGFSVRLSERYRSPYEGTIQNAFGFRNYTQILDDRQLDGSIGYSFQSGPLKGLDVLLQGLNLLNNAYRDTSGPLNNPSTVSGGFYLPPLLAQQPQTYELYGRTYLLGFSYKR